MMTRVRAVWVVRIAVGTVWLSFGLLLKVAGLAPHHLAIVARFFGDDIAPLFTILIGLGEASIGLWMLSGWRPRTSAASQVLLVATMNTLELTFARDLLLAPYPMVVLNVAMLGAVVWAAWQDVPPARWVSRLKGRSPEPQETADR